MTPQYFIEYCFQTYRELQPKSIFMKIIHDCTILIMKYHIFQSNYFNVCIGYNRLTYSFKYLLHIIEYRYEIRLRTYVGLMVVHSFFMNYFTLIGIEKGDPSAVITDLTCFLTVSAYLWIIEHR